MFFFRLTTKLGYKSIPILFFFWFIFESTGVCYFTKDPAMENLIIASIINLLDIESSPKKITQIFFDIIEDIPKGGFDESHIIFS